MSFLIKGAGSPEKWLAFIWQPLIFYRVFADNNNYNIWHVEDCVVSVEVDTFESIAVLNVSGRFFTDSIDYVNDIWTSVLEKNPRIIAINCSNLSCIDSSAVGTLVRFLNYAMEQDIKLIFLELNKEISRLFETAKLNNFFTITSASQFCSKYKITLRARAC